MAKKNDKKTGVNTNTILLAGLILLVIFLARNGMFSNNVVIEGDQIDQFNYEDPEGLGQCEISLNKETYCTGDWVKATLEGPANTMFYVGTNRDSAGWNLWGTVTTDSSGSVVRQGIVNDPGHYLIRGISDSCITNLVETDVIVCPGDAPDPDHCWWQLIDRYDGPFPQLTRTEWKNTLVPGKYQWEFKTSAGNNMPVTFTKEMTSIDYFPDSWWIFHQIDVPTSAKYGIVVENSQGVDVPGFIELKQWVCETDDLNWDPNMFDAPYAQQDLEGPNQGVA